MIWKPTVKTGLSEVIGSWKTKPISPPRTRRISRAASVQEVAAAEGDRPARDLGRRAAGSSPSSDIMVTDLPDPLSPTTPSSSPGREREATRR